MARKDIEGLRPEVQDLARSWLNLCAAEGLDIVVLCTYRSEEEQGILWKKGRKVGKRVTRDSPKTSPHPKGRAIDFLVLDCGKPLEDWDIEDTENEWTIAGELAESLGFLWSGRSGKFRDAGHIEWRGVLSEVMTVSLIDTHE